MNTQKPKLPDEWEKLLADRWQKGKELKNGTYYFVAWERVQIRGKGENPSILNLFVIGESQQWTKAGSLKRKDDRWFYEPVKTNDTPDILESIVIQFLKRKPKKTEEESDNSTDF